MSFDPTLLMLSLVPNGIGVFLFMYGKKQERLAHIAAGIVFMVYPYFVSTVLQMLLGGALIGGVFWWALQAGW
ncbi:MAG TPA: hypothetical protein VEP46_10945 [Vicinamibacterales bacterium]|nr:hypothetical protein [Vicinamibacterales bacterium]